MTDFEEPEVGRAIRFLRNEQELSLRELSERCGLSINAISKIERGETSPTVSSLQHLASALEVHITDLFKPAIHQVSIFVKASDVTILESEGLIIEGLGEGLPHQQIEPYKMIVAPKAGNTDDPVSHSGEEFVYCMKGSLEYFIGDESFILEPGDRLLFKASRPHCWRNPGTEPAEIILILETDRGQPVPHKIH